MAQKTATLNIKVTGQQTLGQIEDELTQINEELKGVDVNSKAFKDLSKQAQKAKFSLDEVNNSLEGVTNVKRAEGAKKLGEGLVGGFAAASAAAALFGDESSEALQKATQKAVLMFTALDGLEKVSKAFSKEATDGLKSMVVGFQKSTIAAKLFGTTTRAALTATGIGALLIGLTLMITYWEDITKFTKDLIGINTDLNDEYEAQILLVKNLNDEAIIRKSLIDDEIALLDALGDNEERILDLKKERLEIDSAIAVANAIQTRKQIALLEDDLANAIRNSIGTGTFGRLGAVGQLLFGESPDDIKKELEELNVALKKQIREIETIDNTLEILNILASKRTVIEEVINTVIEKQIVNTAKLEAINKKAISDLRTTNKILGERLRLAQEEGLPLTRQREIELEITEIRFKNITLLEQQLELSERFKDGSISQQDLEIEDLRLRNEYLNLEYQILKLIDEETKSNQINLKLNIEARNERELELQANILHAELVEKKFIPLLREANQLIVDEKEDWLNNADAIDLMNLKLEKSALAISLIGDVAAIGFEAMLVGLDNRLIDLDKRLAKIRKEQEDFNENEIDYQELLKDANGEKFDEIQAGMLAQDSLRNDLAQQEKNALNEIAKAENEQAKIQKQQAIVQSVIDTALAVVSALPNIPLSIIVGALGLASTATIAAKKIPLQPTFSDGGFTGSGDKYEEAGIVHKGELVVPQEVLATEQGFGLAQALEGLRGSIQGFADGGMVGGSLPVPTSTNVSNNINQQPIWVSVAEIESVGRNVRVLQNNASI